MSDLKRQRGVAIITALVVVAAATVAVAGMLWRQSVAVRKLENQNALAQARWLGRSAVEWARLILLQDAKTSAVDHAGELWAIPLAETRVADTLASGSNAAKNDDSDATISGQIVDAQSRFNLANLTRVTSVTGLAINAAITPNPQANTQATASSPLPVPKTNQDQAPDDGINHVTLAVLERLLEMTGQRDEAALVIAQRLTQLPRPLDFDQLALELVQTHQIEAAVVEALRPYVVLLPKPVPVNFNTASPEVMAASLPSLSLSQARLLTASRDRVFFNQVPDVFARLATVNAAVDTKAANNSTGIAVASHYFEVNGQVHYGRAEYRLSALIERENSGQTRVLSLKEQ